MKLKITILVFFIYAFSIAQIKETPLPCGDIAYSMTDATGTTEAVRQGETYSASRRYWIDGQKRFCITPLDNPELWFTLLQSLYRQQ